LSSHPVEHRVWQEGVIIRIVGISRSKLVSAGPWPESLSKNHTHRNRHIFCVQAIGVNHRSALNKTRP